jgi:ribonuclease P protein component
MTLSRWTTAEAAEQRFRETQRTRRLWKTSWQAGRLYCPLARPRYPFIERRRRETNLSTQRPAPKAATRVPSEDVVARRPSDTEAAARERPQAPLRLSRPPVQRRNRLSRSRDFDAVYRRGKSTSTRHLVLHWFPREENGDGEPRLGLAVPRSVGSAVVRNRVKRLLREAWRELLESVPPGHDYVLAARPGFAEPADVRGRAWLVSEIADALERVRP